MCQLRPLARFESSPTHLTRFPVVRVLVLDPVPLPLTAPRPTEVLCPPPTSAVRSNRGPSGFTNATPVSVVCRACRKHASPRIFRSCQFPASIVNPAWPQSVSLDSSHRHSPLHAFIFSVSVLACPCRRSSPLRSNSRVSLPFTRNHYPSSPQSSRLVHVRPRAVFVPCGFQLRRPSGACPS